MKAPRRILYGSLVFALAVIWTLALSGYPLLAIAWGLGFSTGCGAVGLAVKVKLESRATCPMCGGAVTALDSIFGQATRYYQCAEGHRIVARDGVLTPQATPTGDPAQTKLVPVGWQNTAIGQVRCETCDRPTHQVPHPGGGDSWYFECDRGHHTIIGK